MSKAKTKRRKVNQQAKARAGVTVSLGGSEWDQGAMGQANRIGLVVEPRGTLDPATGKTINPNAVKGARRVDMMETYHKRGWISDRGFTAGERLRDAWEDTQRGPGWADNDRVQSSAKPDQAIAMQLDRIGRLVWLTKRMPKDHAALIEAVCMKRVGLASATVDGVKPFTGSRHDEGARVMRVAFDALADAFGG